MTAYVFTITQRETGALRAAAVVCPDARYASIAWLGRERIDRKFLTPAAWQAVLAQLGTQLPTGPLDPDSALTKALGLDSSTALQYLSQEPVTEDTNGQVLVPVLDRRLQDVVTR